MKTENRIIAEFMGGNKSPISGAWRLTAEGRLYMDNDLSYHSSWDWLMPVVDKIESIPHPNFGNDFKFTFEICSYSCTVRVIHSDAFNKIVSHNSSKIDSVYDCVVQFIKWHNAQKTTAYTSDNISTSSDIDKVK